MAFVTFQILEGLERGQVFTELPTPLTIGREDDNAIQLNDERVSRFHTKVQEDGDRIILTDLESTNGTRINGHPVQMRVLQPGDHLSIGRCLLVFGSREEIEARMEHERIDQTQSGLDNPTLLSPEGSSDELDATPEYSVDVVAYDDDEVGELFPNGPPEIPIELSLVQQAQFSDVLAYVHDCIQSMIQAAQENRDSDDAKANSMTVDWETWQKLLHVELQLAVYLRKAADPDG